MASLTPRPVGQPTSFPRTTQSTSTQFLYYTLALVAIIAAVCVLSFCYRSLYFSRFLLCKYDDSNVEVIIEADVVVEIEANYAYAETSAETDDGFYALYDPTSTAGSPNNKPKFWGRDSESESVTVARVLGQGEQENMQACTIDIMDTVQFSSPPFEG